MRRVDVSKTNRSILWRSPIFLKLIEKYISSEEVQTRDRLSRTLRKCISFRAPTNTKIDEGGAAAHSCQFKNNNLTEMCSGSEAGSYLRLKDFFSQL